MTVADNMGFALKISRVAKPEIRRRVEEAAWVLGLGDYLDRKPKFGEVVVPLPREVRTRLAGAATVTLGFRPEAVEIVGAEVDAVPFQVEVVEKLGAEALAHGRVPGHERDLDDMLTVRVDAGRPPTKGELIHLRIRPDETHLFDADGHRIGS